MAKQFEQYYGPLSPAKIKRVYDILSEHIEPKSDLEFDTHYELLVAVVLSAQATDKSVNEACEKLYPVAKTPAAMVKLGEKKLISYIKTIGLYRNKAKNVIKLSQILLDEHNGEVPNDRAALEALPGVGRKTANVVLNIAFGEPTIAVDTHVHRISQRLGIADCKTVEHTEQVLLERTPKKHLLHAHHYLILHGRYCCKARKPECWRCPLTKQCPFEDKQLEAL